MAFKGILECFQDDARSFCAVVVTDGSGAPRKRLTRDKSKHEKVAERRNEQKKAAVVGEYGAVALLDYPSSAAKDGADGAIVAELAALIAAATPDVVYTHNLADKHDTHVAVALRTTAALRQLPVEARPSAVYGCEVWRDLDWMCDEDKVVFDVTDRENLAAALMGVYDSQVSGGKRYDLATAGRRLANATFSESHAVDTAEALNYAMDLMPLVTDPSLDPSELVGDYIRRMEQEVTARLRRLSEDVA